MPETNSDFIAATLIRIRSDFVDDVAHLQRTIGGFTKHTPPQVMDSVTEQLVDKLKHLSDVEECLEIRTEVFQQLRDAKAQLDLEIRKQKRWRVMACRVLLGAAKTEDLLKQAFLDLISDPPDHETLDREIHECVERLEALEQAQAEFGELRAIDVDR